MSGTLYHFNLAETRNAKSTLRSRLQDYKLQDEKTSFFVHVVGFLDQFLQLPVFVFEHFLNLFPLVDNQTKFSLKSIFTIPKFPVCNSIFG